MSAAQESTAPATWLAFLLRPRCQKCQKCLARHPNQASTNLTQQSHPLQCGVPQQMVFPVSGREGLASCSFCPLPLKLVRPLFPVEIYTAAALGCSVALLTGIESLGS